ncbi:MAG: hypothetical protein HY280_03690 [Nitrospinae bacterium]|nr:hypothetical protein [Nitrospinota bacterium]
MNLIKSYFWLRACGVIALLMLSLPQTSNAEISIFGGADYFRWTESVPGTPGVTETGPRFVVGGSLLQNKPSGILLGYRGQVRFGEVDYAGSSQNCSSTTKACTYTPLNSKTSYIDLDNYFSLRYRSPSKSGEHFIDFISGIGTDYWTRTLGSSGGGGYTETYFIGYAKAGMGLGMTGSGPHAEAGIKYPFWTNEYVGLYSAGLSTNDTVISPGKAMSYFASLEYKFKGPWNVMFSYDGYVFPGSSWVNSNHLTTAGGKTTWTQGYVGQPASAEETLALTIGYFFE